MRDETRKEWERFLTGKWQLEMPQQEGRFPVQPRNDAGFPIYAGDWGVEVIYKDPRTGNFKSVHDWGGFWWSEPFPRKL